MVGCDPDPRFLSVKCLSRCSVWFLFLPFSAAQLLSYPGKNKIPLNYHIVEVYVPFVWFFIEAEKLTLCLNIVFFPIR